MSRATFLLRAFEPGDVAAFDAPAGLDLSFVEQCAKADGGRAWTALHGATVVALGGLCPITPAWAWCGLVPAAHTPLDAWKGGLPALRAVLNEAHAHGVRRIDTMVLAGFAAGESLVEWLGFQFAGDHTGWDGAGAKCFLWSRCSPRRQETPDEQAARRRYAAIARDAWTPARGAA